jgi:hypothetical protein
VDGHEVTTVWEAGSRLLQGKVGASVRLSLGSGNSATRQVDLAPLVRPQVLELEPIVEMEESLEANLVLSDGRGGTPKGFVIRDLARGGRGEQLSFRNGDMITSVENHAVDSAKKFNDAVRGLQMFRLEMRHEGGEQQHRVYIRLFPLILAPPVY